MKAVKKIWDGANTKLRDFLASLCFSGPSFLGMLMFFVAPFCVVIYYSFIAGALDHSFVGLKNYINVWNNQMFRLGLKNTMILSLICAPLLWVLSFALSVLLNRIRPAGGFFRQGGAPGGKTCRRWNHGSSLRVVINGAKPVAFTPARCQGKDSMPEKYRQRPYSY